MLLLVVVVLGSSWPTGSGAAFAQEAAAAETRGIPRLNIPLNDLWRSAIVPLETPFDQITGWAPHELPRPFWINPRDDGLGARAGWLRRELAVPADWAGRRVFLILGGAKFDPHVFVDGRLIGSQFDGWSVFELELTGALVPGRTHTLAVRVRDVTATFDPSVQLNAPIPDSALRGRVLAGVGGYRGKAGVWDDVRIEVSPPVRFVESDLEIVTSTRQGTLTIQGRVDGPATDGIPPAGGNPAGGPPGAGWQVEAIVLDGGAEVLRIPASPVAADGRWRASAAFPGARYWSPESPHLYTLRLVLRRAGDDATGAGAGTGEIVDRRFGFREFWIEGPNFYLNGVRRHLFGDSHWPPLTLPTRDEIRARLTGHKSAGADIFRTHIGGWQRAWFEIADEIGMMIIPETPVYTDGIGKYAYTDERFWANYRDHIARMIRMYRNHASVVMFSLGNEILFMGNIRYDAELPRRLGDMARFARTITTHHPLLFDGDRDPDGAYDVINLHYPHEMPANFAYPNTADWVGRVTETEAGGGMLGQVRGHFFWQRDEPLFIGEYLWAPHEDYSVASIFHGDDAFLNRDRFHRKSQEAAVHDQTFAYRRARVSAFTPWIDYGSELKESFRRVGAFPFNRDARVFAGDSYTFEFDVFNDSTSPLALTLRLTERNGRTPPLSESFALDPAGYLRVPMTITAPLVQGQTTLVFDAVLEGDGREVHRVAHERVVFPRQTLAAPPGFTVVAYDPTGAWPDSVRSLDRLADADPNRTILLIAPGAVGTPAVEEVPTIGQAAFDTGAFLRFVLRGGRAVVLEQSTLRPLGLELDLVEHAATMNFPVSDHPLLAGLDRDDLMHWRGDHFVSQYEIRRPTSGGARAVAISGGPRTLDQSSILELPVGQGRVVLFQALVGRKLHSEPAAFRLLQNSLDYLAAVAPQAAGRTVAVSADPAFLAFLRSLRVEFTAPDRPLTPADLQGVSLVLLHGGGDRIVRSGPALAAFHRAGQGRIYWNNPDPAAFAALGPALGLGGLAVQPANKAVAILERDARILTGVLREDLTYMLTPIGWDRQTALLPAARHIFVPADASDQPIASFRPVDMREGAPPTAAADAGGLTLTRPGRLTASVNVAQPGLHRLVIDAAAVRDAAARDAAGRDGAAGARAARAQLTVFINDVIATSIYPESTTLESFALPVHLTAGDNQIVLSATPTAPGQPFGHVRVESVRITQRLNFPAATHMLTTPGGLVSVDAALPDAIVLDGVALEPTGPNATRARRYASTLLANLGAAFTAPTPGPTAQAIPLRAFRLIGESAYFEAQPGTLLMRNNADVEAAFRCVAPGRYTLRLRGHSTLARGGHAIIRFQLNGQTVGEVELSSVTSAVFDGPTVRLTPGNHTLRVSFINDLFADGEDRNAYVEEVSFIRR